MLFANVEAFHFTNLLPFKFYKKLLNLNKNKLFFNKGKNVEKLTENVTCFLVDQQLYLQAACCK